MDSSSNNSLHALHAYYTTVCMHCGHITSNCFVENMVQETIDHRLLYDYNILAVVKIKSSHRQHNKNSQQQQFSASFCKEKQN